MARSLPVQAAAGPDAGQRPDPEGNFSCGPLATGLASHGAAMIDVIEQAIDECERATEALPASGAAAYATNVSWQATTATAAARCIFRLARKSRTNRRGELKRSPSWTRTRFGWRSVERDANHALPVWQRHRG